MTGIVNINKPYGRSSHFAVAVIRRVTKIKKVGHTGTLDPLATGVLPVCIGRESTKLSDIIMNSPKQYKAVIKLGISTTTQDSEGEITKTCTPDVSEEKLKTALNKFTGPISQIPPMYSAIKINGKKLYELARKGVEIKREPRPVMIFSIELISFDKENCEALICVDCSKGTYIRTLCNDIGEELGCGGYMKSLVRTKCGGFDIKDSITLEEFEELWNKEQFDKILTPPEVYKKD